MSGFKMVGGYPPVIAGLLQLELSDGIVNAHKEQVETKALLVLERSNTPNAEPAKKSFFNEKVCYFKRGPRFGAWHEVFVRETEKHMILLSTTSEHRGNPVRCAYEDVRKVL